MKRFMPLFLLLLLVQAYGVSAEPLKVFVSIAPQKYFVERIGGDEVDVRVMVAPGANPHNYEPKPSQMTGLAQTSIYFSIGVPFEQVWLPRFLGINKNMKVVATDQGIRKIPMAEHDDGDEEGGSDAAHSESAASEEEEHDHGGMDPHIWLSPPLVKVQAKNILQGLVQARPESATTFEKNYRSFLQELGELDARIRNILADRQGNRFIVFHPSWGYFAEAYDLEETPIELEGKEPTPAELAELIGEAQELEIKVIFVQPQFSRKSAETIARSIGGRVVVADPLAADWANNLLKVAKEFREAAK